MSADRDPWWSSGVGPGGEPHGDGPESSEAAGPRDAGGDGQSRAPHTIDVCGVCPICVGLRLLGDTRPELLAHLAEAARHLAAAARTLIEDQDDARPPAESPARDRVTRIDLD